MEPKKINWTAHLVAFEKSGQRITEYCRAAEIKVDAFRYQLYKTRPRKRRGSKEFQEFSVAPELILSLGSGDSLNIQGIDPTFLPTLVRAWSNAVSK